MGGRSIGKALQADQYARAACDSMRRMLDDPVWWTLSKQDLCGKVFTRRAERRMYFQPGSVRSFSPEC